MTPEAHGLAIVLNGTSSSGKTSIARALQAAHEKPLLLVGVDMIISMMPYHYTGIGSMAAQGYAMAPGEKDGVPCARIAPGPLAYALNQELADLTDRLIRQGHDVIVDHVIPDQETLAPFVHALRDHRAWFVGVRCDLAVTQKREHKRGDRLPGTAAAQHLSLHEAAGRYDLELDTSHTPPADLAARLADLMKSDERPSAFQSLARSLETDH